MAWLGDHKEEGYFPGQIAPIKETNGVGIPTIKPWANREEFKKRVKWSLEIGAMALATDLDAIGLGYQYSGKPGSKNEGVCARNVEELKEFVQSVDVPVIIKGIMSVKAALKAAETGAYAILVSNHGGNVVEGSLAPCDVVEDICKAVGSPIKVFADGGVRSGEDVFKMLALGAEAVRDRPPLCGGGIWRRAGRGVNLYTEYLL